MNVFNTSQLPPMVHENRNYEPDQVRHLKIYPVINSSVSGQYGSRNFSKLIELINEAYKGAKIYFVDARQDTHFELNNRPVSLKRIVQNDDNTQFKGDEVVAKEKGVAAYFTNKMVTFVPKEEHGKPWEEMVTQSSIVRDFIENTQWEGRHTFYRFPLNEHGPLTDAQVDEFIELSSRIDAEGAWLHTNSIVGGASAILLILMKDILKNASVDTLEQIISRYEGAAKFLNNPKEDDENRQSKIQRTLFIHEFYTFAKTRTQNQRWCDWIASKGMTAMEAIKAGTQTNAELLQNDTIGTIEPGKYADIIAVAKDPLQDISELERVKFVMLGGELIKHEN